MTQRISEGVSHDLLLVQTHARNANLPRSVQHAWLGAEVHSYMYGMYVHIICNISMYT